MILEQPLIKPAVTGDDAVVVSGNELASEAGRIALEKGGNVVDAMIADVVRARRRRAGRFERRRGRAGDRVT